MLRDVLHFINYPSADPEQPDLGKIEKKLTELHIHWKKSTGVVDYYTIAANCSCNCNKSINHFGVDISAHITGLMPGTHCNVTITAVSGGRYSRPLIYYDIETLESGKTYFLF